MLHSSQFLSTRRRFLSRLGLCGIAASFPASRILASTGASVPAIAEAQSTMSVVKNRAPLAANAFYSLPLGSIRPRGWLKDQLRLQANGLGGHLDETWADVGPNSGWLGLSAPIRPSTRGPFWKPPGPLKGMSQKRMKESDSTTWVTPL